MDTKKTKKKEPQKMQKEQKEEKDGQAKKQREGQPQSLAILGGSLDSLLGLSLSAFLRLFASFCGSLLVVFSVSKTEVRGRKRGGLCG
jgi:hypothetical protein